MRKDYNKGMALAAVWFAVAATAIFAPNEVVGVAGYGVGASFLIAFFV